MRLSARVATFGSLLLVPFAAGLAQDTTPPTIRVEPFWVISSVFDPACSPLQLPFRAEDDTGVVSIHWQNNWGDGGTIPGAQGGLFSMDLRDGTTLFSFEAVDAAGNRGSGTFTANYKPVDTSSPAWNIDGTAAERVRAAVWALGDVNGDHFEDVVISAGDYVRLYRGAVDGPLLDPSWFLPRLSVQSVAAAGDVNRDGYADVIVGTRTHNNGNNTGHASLYLGSPAGLSNWPAWVTSGAPTARPTTYGAFVAPAGDVNRDGYADVLVVDPYLPGPLDPFVEQGRAYLFHGSAGGLRATAAWTAIGDESHGDKRTLGGAASAGDVNGDGFDDVVDTLRDGTIRLYQGSWEGLRSTPSWTATTPQDPDYSISAVGAGDVNRDGFDDVIVGCPACSLGANTGGAAFVYTGSAGGLLASPSWMVGGDSLNAQLGIIASAAGDVDGDGYSDVLVSEYITVCDSLPRFHLYRGSAAGIEARPFRTIRGGGQQYQFMIAAVSAGDVNGDGLDDLLIGDATETSYGRASLYAGVSDNDRDGFSAVQDCDDSGDQVWSEPGSVEGLAFAPDGVTLTWLMPVSMGGPESTARFDVLRSIWPDGFGLSGSATCIETNEGPERLAVDDALPPPSGLFIYVARARNGCGEGPVSSDSAGVSYPGPTCP